MLHWNGLKHNRYRCLYSLLIVFLGTSVARGAILKPIRVASGLARPVYVVSPPGDRQRLFIVEQHTGRIKILNQTSGQIDEEPFLDIDGLADRNEQGLLGLAFDPNYADNGWLYVNLTVAGTNATEIRRYSVSTDDPNLADPQSDLLIMTFAQPFRNHNAGWLEFGPDGYLYITSGDGGSGNDPGDRAQDITDQKLGKLLRVDVRGDDFLDDPQRNYAIPPDNPFVGLEGDDEIWSFGLRNPWRISFDRETGDLWMGDVGQGQREEINFQPADSPGGENYGWRVMEGRRCNIPSNTLACNDSSLVPPVYDYGHTGPPNGGFSVTGGYVYRGPIRALRGHYFFADFVTEQIWSFRYTENRISEFTNWTELLIPDQGRIGQISSFGEDALGNLYIVDLGGEVFKLTCEGDLPGDFDGDCDVDGFDFAHFAQSWRGSNQSDTEGNTGVLDLAAISENWLVFEEISREPPSTGTGRTR